MCCACGGGNDPTSLFAVDGGLNAPSWLIELNSADRYVWNRLVAEQLAQGNIGTLEKRNNQVAWSIIRNTELG